jgi:hypothetical protein
MVKKKNQVQMVFLPSSRVQQGIDRFGMRDTLKEFTSDLKSFKDWFSGYEIDTIELWIEGAVTSEGITKLFVSFEGKGGCKVTLKPSSP